MNSEKKPSEIKPVAAEKKRQEKKVIKKKLSDALRKNLLRRKTGEK